MFFLILMKLFAVQGVNNSILQSKKTRIERMTAYDKVIFCVFYDCDG